MAVVGAAEWVDPAPSEVIMTDVVRVDTHTHTHTHTHIYIYIYIYIYIMS